MDEKSITQEQAAATVQDAQAQEPAAGASDAQQPAAPAAAPEKNRSARSPGRT